MSLSRSNIKLVAHPNMSEKIVDCDINLSAQTIKSVHILFCRCPPGTYVDGYNCFPVDYCGRDNPCFSGCT